MSDRSDTQLMGLSAITTDAKFLLNQALYIFEHFMSQALRRRENDGL